MALKLLKEEVLHEMEAVKCFIELAIMAQKGGYFKAAEYFLGQAQEDCHHSFNYARELDKHDEVPGDMNIVQIVEKFHQLESGAVDRVLAIQDEISQENYRGLAPFILHMLDDHSNEAYTAKKLLQRVSILAPQEAVNDIEEVFSALLENEE